jgi:hypothetical protein
MELPPQISVKYMPKRTMLETLHTCHKETLARASQKPLKRFQSLQDIIQAQDRMNALKAAFREEVGEVSREELERSIGSRSDITDSVYEEIQDIRDREKNRTGL